VTDRIALIEGGAESCERNEGIECGPGEDFAVKKNSIGKEKEIKN